MGEYDDPGWADALKRVWAFPFVAFLLLRRRVPQVAMLIGVRRTFVALVTSMFSILVVLGFIGMPWTFGDSPVWAPFLIAGIAAYATVVSLWIRRRALPCSSEQQLAGAWAGAYFISIGVSESVALMGFVLTFIADGNAWYLVGLGVTLPLLAASAPTRRSIERTQVRLDTQGCPFQLGRVLTKPKPTDETE